jgi:YD repeat-containing protein
MSDPVLGTVHFHYDPRRMLVSANTDDGRNVSFAYDENRNRTVETDSRGRTVRFGYDERNEIAAVVDPLGGTWSMKYDPNGNLVSAADPQGRLATFAYTFRNELQTVVDRSGTTTRFGYDPGGHLLAEPHSQGAISDGPLGLAIRPNIRMVPDPLSGQAQRVTDARDEWTARADLHLDPGTNNRRQAPLERVLVPMRSLAQLRYHTDGTLAGWRSDVADPASFEGTLTLHVQAVVDLVSEPRISLTSVLARLLHPVYEPITTTAVIR